MAGRSTILQILLDAVVPQSPTPRGSTTCQKCFRRQSHHLAHVALSIFTGPASGRTDFSASTQPSAIRVPEEILDHFRGSSSYTRVFRLTTHRLNTRHVSHHNSCTSCRSNAGFTKTKSINITTRFKRAGSTTSRPKALALISRTYRGPFQ